MRSCRALEIPPPGETAWSWASDTDKAMGLDLEGKLPFMGESSMELCLGMDDESAES